ncbi:hypothetical protein [Sphingobacterium sp.]|uniref:hypothetical protein n=1 Tax=Sphingobacterium sp. TaxID=341027 RepID=UPI002899472A|nr:hypothetical protein [Sphingobacterium sp.]
MLKYYFMTLSACILFSTSMAQRRQQATLNVLGTTPLIGLKYDTRIFKEQNDGFGVNAGLGSIDMIDDSDHKASVVLGTNYLFGKGQHQFLLGANVAFVFSRIYPLDAEPINTTRTIFIPDIGYRFSPRTKGFTGQITWNPLRSNLDREAAYQYFGIGIGYSWK